MNIITVKINGMEYNLRGEENNEYLQMVAQYVDNKINSIMLKNAKLSCPDATILAAINLGDEVFKNKESFERVSENYKSLSIEHKDLISETQIIKRDYEKIKNENEKLVVDLETISGELKLAKEELESDNLKVLESKVEKQKKLLEEKEEEITYLKQQLEIMKEVEANLKSDNKKQYGFSKKLLAENNDLRYKQMAKIRQIEELTKELEEKNFKLMKSGQGQLVKK